MRLKQLSMGQQFCSREQENEEPAITLFWSRRGDIACAPHAPDPDSAEWAARGWCVIPAFAAAVRHGLTYQCPLCASDRRSYRRVYPVERPSAAPISRWSHEADTRPGRQPGAYELYEQRDGEHG